MKYSVLLSFALYYSIQLNLVLAESDVSVSTTAKTLNHTTDEDFNEEILNNFIGSLVRQLDTKVNPCDDFATYACHSIRDQLERGPRPDPIQAMLEAEIVNARNLSGVEMKFQNYIQSCQTAETDVADLFDNVDVLAAIGDWPVKKSKFNSNAAIALWAKVTAIRGVNHILQINIDDEMNLNIGAPFGYPFPLPIEITNLMKTYGTIALIAEQAASEIKDFMDKLSLILYEPRGRPVQLDLMQVPEIDWMTFFFTLLPEWQLNQMKDIKEVKIIDSRVKKIGNLIRTTEPHVFANFLVYQIVSYLVLARDSCNQYFDYFRPVIYHKVWQQFLNKEDELKLSQIIDQFEGGFNQTFLNRTNLSQEIVIANSRNLRIKLNNQRSFISNHNTLFENLKRELNYELIKIDSQNYFQNILNIGMNFMTSAAASNFAPPLRNKYLEQFSSLGTDFQYSLIDNHNKPLWQYFVTKSMELWQSGLQENLRLIQTTSDEIMFCLSEQGSNATSIFETWDYINLYAALKNNYDNFLDWIEKSKEKLKKDIEILHKFDLDLKKAHFISLAQQLCLYAEQADRSAQLYQMLKNFDKFAETFNCTEGSYMNVKDKCVVLT